jgi:phosphomannomutase / phosphoglucomutase
VSDLSCFMAYDIRGRVPEEVDAALARDVGRAFVAELGARRVVVGRDVRLESPMLASALIAGLTGSGADVIDIGLCGTEEVYFGTVHHGADGGIMVTASHNPKGYNGMKLVRAGAQPVSGESGLLAIRDRIAAGDLPVWRDGATAGAPPVAAGTASGAQARGPGSGGAGPGEAARAWTAALTRPRVLRLGADPRSRHSLRSVPLVIWYATRTRPPTSATCWGMSIAARCGR